VYCGIDRHARRMYVCILRQDGESLRHRNMHTSPELFLQALAPSREELVVCVACLFPWYWLAARCAREAMPFVLGHALDMTAIHGGTAKNDKRDAQTSAVLLRGGLWPPAEGYPAAMRAPRDLLRRRRPLVRKRAELLTHVQHTNRQYNVPERGKDLAYQTNRPGVAERCADPAVQKSVEVDLALIDYYDQLRRALEWAIVQTAKPQDATTLYWLQPVPGIGTILRLVLLYESHAIPRFPRGQDFVSSCRVVQCAQASAGKRYGPAGAKIGTASLQGAFSAAAVRLLRNNPGGHKSLARLEHQHGKGKALTVLAHTLARAIY
jgi:transposase